MLLKPWNTRDLFHNPCVWVFLSWTRNTIAAPRLTTQQIYYDGRLMPNYSYQRKPGDNISIWRATPNLSWLRSCDISQTKGPEWPGDDSPVLNLALSASDVLCDFQGYSEWHHSALQHRRDPQIWTGRVISFTKTDVCFKVKIRKKSVLLHQHWT